MGGGGGGLVACPATVTHDFGNAIAMWLLMRSDTMVGNDGFGDPCLTHTLIHLLDFIVPRTVVAVLQHHRPQHLAACKPQ